MPRIAKCVGLTGPVTLLGTRATLMIGPEWQGDLDQVISDGLTVADALGPDLLAHFEPVAAAAKSSTAVHKSPRSNEE
jgi:hypothetical protein